MGEANQVWLLRRLVVLLAALVTLVLADCVGLVIVPAAHASAAQNSVQAFTPAAQPTVGPATSEIPCSRPGSTVLGEQIAADFCVATEDAGGLSFGDKISGQMAGRGWTEQSIEDTVAKPYATHDVWDYTSGSREPATAYENADGAYVVVNDQTGQVVQISDANDSGWRPVWNDPRFQR
jgi:hypothetical protein